MVGKDRLTTDASCVLALFDDEERTSFMREHGVAAGDISGRFDASTVLHWIVRKRTSFIAMASEIGNLLTTLEASIHGNIDFVAFPVKGVDLKIPFGPQVRALLVAAHDASLSDSFIELSKKIELLAEAVHQFSSSCRPQSVIRDTGYGRKARELSRASHGTPEGFRYGMTADLLARRKREYSPVDACLLVPAEGVQHFGNEARGIAGIQAAPGFRLFHQRDGRIGKDASLRQCLPGLLAQFFVLDQVEPQQRGEDSEGILPKC